MRNLITGIGGFVASHMADLLLQRGEEVYGTYRWAEDTQKVNHLEGKFTRVPCDLLDLSSCVRAIEKHRPDRIYHLAAQSFVTDSYDNPVVTIQANTIGTVNLLEAIRILKERDGYDPRVHICSTSEVYGMVKKEDLPIKETQSLNPGNPYAVGKLGGDIAALVYWTNFGVKTLRTRAFTHTGPRRTMMSAECNFARQIARIEQGKQEPIIYHGNLDSVRTWTDARDMAEAYRLLLERGQPGEVYNICGDTVKTIGEMLDHLISLSPEKDRIKKMPDQKLMRPNDVSLQIADCSKFKAETGWKPEITFEQTMADLLNWWRQTA